MNLIRSLIQSFYVHPSENISQCRKLEHSFAVEARHLEQMNTPFQPFDYIIIDMSSELNERNMTVPI